jgi:hypothetical protein
MKARADIGGDYRLGREISLLLVFKLAAISALWYLFFGPTHQVVVTPAKVDARLFAVPPAAPAHTSRPRS